jgi:hypothetical protein
MEKIIMISPDTEASKTLLQCLELLFPECTIESLTGKMNNAAYNNGIDSNDAAANTIAL